MVCFIQLLCGLTVFLSLACFSQHRLAVVNVLPNDLRLKLGA
jgi:hypothetical protein